MTGQTAARVADSSVGSQAAGSNFDIGQPLPPALLYRRCDPAELPFALCTELEEAPGLIGQERAVEAIRFAMRMRRKGYNVYALGASGTGRHGAVEDLLRGRAQSDPTPPDWCYVNNFADPQKPRCLQLPAGRGAGLAAAMKRLVEELRGALPAAFERDEYRSRREVIDQQFKQRNEAAFGALQKRAQQKGIVLLRTPMGMALAPVRDGKVLEPDAFEALPASERESVQHEIEATQSELEAIMRQVPQWEREHRDAVRDLSRETTGFAIVHLMEEVRATYGDLPEVAKYLDAVEADVKENADDFLAPPAPSPDATNPARVPAPISPAIEESHFRRYGVNLLVDNGSQHGAPVIYEDNPTHQTLVGRVEHLARFGALVTDFNLLTPGALHRANGGYLILDAQKLLTGNFGWPSLKRALDAGQIRIETPEQLMSA